MGDISPWRPKSPSATAIMRTFELVLAIQHVLSDTIKGAVGMLCVTSCKTTYGQVFLMHRLGQCIAATRQELKMFSSSMKKEGSVNKKPAAAGPKAALPF